MNQYTIEEIKVLLAEIQVLRGSAVVGINGFFVDEATFFAFIFMDPGLDPKEILPFYSKIGSREISELIMTRNLIYYIPIHEIPLYINISPVAAKWRLEMGK